MSDIKIQAQRNEQSAADKADTLTLLKSKKRRTKTVTFKMGDEEVELTFQALSQVALDKIQGLHPPTPEQTAKGMVFNKDTFPPALVAACSYDPKLSLKDANEIWNSPEWSTGELNYLFDTASRLCMEGLDIPFTATD